MAAARVKFAIFIAAVLALPAALMALGNPQAHDLGKLAMITSPGLTGFILNGGLGDRGMRARWRNVTFAALITLAVAGGALAIAICVGAVTFGNPPTVPRAAASALAVTALTSVLEELGWAAGGLALATAALGRRWGVAVLGLVWAAWHLGPALLKGGLFPGLEIAPPAMLAAFCAGCLIYRELLTRLREDAGTWWAAAAGHAAPNMFMVGLVTVGMNGLDRPGPAWTLFPAPGGLVFPLLVLIAVWSLPRKAGSAAAKNIVIDV